jgi:hypothetical protein
MLARLNAIKPFAVQEANKAREKVAGELLNLDGVKAAIIEAAMRGEFAVKLPLGALAVELRGTEAAAQLAAWAKENRLKLEWVERNIERPNGLKVKVAEAVLSWGEENIVTG